MIKETSQMDLKSWWWQSTPSPISSAECERGFTQINMMCTSTRACLHTSTISGLHWTLLAHPWPNSTQYPMRGHGLLNDTYVSQTPGAKHEIGRWRRRRKWPCCGRVWKTKVGSFLYKRMYCLRASYYHIGRRPIYYNMCSTFILCEVYSDIKSNDCDMFVLLLHFCLEKLGEYVCKCIWRVFCSDALQMLLYIDVLKIRL